eukprot:Gb_27855 [translate_table: standard]
MDFVRFKTFLKNDGKRRLKTPSQVEGLERFYTEHKYPSEAMKAKLAVELMLSEKQVHKWFCHRRQKEKRVKNADTGSGRKPIPSSCLNKDGSRKVKRLSLSSLKIVENRRASNIMDYPTAALAWELRGQHVLPENQIATENTYAGLSSSQDRSSLQNGSPCEMQSTRRRLQSGNPCKIQQRKPSLQVRNPHKIEAKRKKRRDLEFATEYTYLPEVADHEAVLAVKTQLRRLFCEDGPPLSVEFDPLPPGAFDTPIESCYPDIPVSRDLQRMSKKRKMGNSCHVPELNSMQLDRDSANEAPMSAFVTLGSRSCHKKIAAGRSGGKALLPYKYAAVPTEVRNMAAEVHISDLHHNAEELEENPDANSAMPEEEDGQLLSFQGAENVQPKKKTKRGKQRQMQVNQKQRRVTKCNSAYQKANAKKQPKRSAQLIDDEQLELRELHIAPDALAFGAEVDETGRRNADYSEGLMGRFPPASLRMKQPLLARPWSDSKENVKNLFTVLRFLYTFADAIELCPFTLDEFVQAFHDHDSKLLGQIHIALLKLLLDDVESELKSFTSAGGSTRHGSAFNDCRFLRITKSTKSRGFDVKVWREFLNPLTWPEILRQVALEAGFGPKQKKEVQMSNKSISKGESQIAPHGLVPGTLKHSLFHILSRKGTTGLKISEMVKHIQDSDLNDLPSSNGLEPLICSTLSSDITLFERISSLAFRVRANHLLTRDEEQYHSCSESSADVDSDSGESDSEGSDTDETGKSGYEEQDLANASETMRKGVNQGILQAMPSVKEGGSYYEAIEDRRNESLGVGNFKGVGRPCDGGTEIDESHAGEAWVLGLMEGEYAELSVEEKLNALVALVNIVNAGNSIRNTIQDPSRMGSQFLSQVQPHRFGDKKGSNKKGAAKKYASVDPSSTETRKNRGRGQLIPKSSDLSGHIKSHSKSLQASEQSRRDSYSMESICLGSDRRHNTYWQFSCGCSLQESGHGRVYFESSEDGHWEVIDTQEALDTLMALLDGRGIREANLLASLRDREALIRQEMSKARAGSNQEMLSHGSEKSGKEFVSGDSSSGASIIENNQNGTASEPENDSSDLFGAISLEFGRTDVEKQHEWDRCRAFDKWVWSDFFQTLKVLKYNPDLLVSCESCHDLYWPDEEHCMLCHTTFELDFDLEERYAVHVARCKERHPDQSFQEHKVLSSQLQSLKAGMQAIEAVLPEEALEVAWKKSGQKVWVKRLRRAASPNELAQV